MTNNGGYTTAPTLPRHNHCPLRPPLQSRSHRPPHSTETWQASIPLAMTTSRIASTSPRPLTIGRSVDSYFSSPPLLVLPALPSSSTFPNHCLYFPAISTSQPPSRNSTVPTSIPPTAMPFWSPPTPQSYLHLFHQPSAPVQTPHTLFSVTRVK